MPLLARALPADNCQTATGAATALKLAEVEMAIYCPLCAWRPGPGSRWICRPGCGMVWNTFDTRGICPRCYKVWKYTVCLRCREMPLHDDWYHDDLGDAVLDTIETTVGAGTLIPV